MKKIFLDTSVLIPLFVESHPNHKICFSYLEKLYQKKFEIYTSSHAILEFYSVYSKLPLKKRISTQLLKEIIETNIYSNFKISTLTEKEYRDVIYFASNSGFVGGIVYDVIHYFCAKKEKIDSIITYNITDFTKINFSGLRISEPF